METNLEDVKSWATQEAKSQLREYFDSKSLLHLPRFSRPRVSILLVLYNRAELTLSCLRSLQPHLETANAEIVLVDNASSDETSKLFDSIRGATIVRNSRNQGYAEGVNRAAAAAVGEYLLFLNNDTRLLDDSLNAAINFLSTHGDVGAVGGRIVLLDGTLQEAGCTLWREGDAFQYGRGDNPASPEYLFQRDVDYCSGAFLMTRRELFEKMNGLDPAFAVGYFEDIDYCVRLWRAGWRVVYLPEVMILHYENGSSDDPTCIPPSYRRNHLYFTRKHADWLAFQCPSTTPRLWARGSHDDRFRILYLTRADSDHQASSDATMIRCLRELNCFVTVYPIVETSALRDNRKLPWPADVEVLTGDSLKTLPRFLTQRRNYYDLLITNDAKIAKFTKRWATTRTESNNKAHIEPTIELSGV